MISACTARGRVLRRVGGLLAGVWLGGCVATQPVPQGRSGGEVPSHLVEFEARVVHVNLEGGFYGLVADNGVRYEPLELAPRFRRVGMRLRVHARPADVASIRMWGKPVHIVDAEPLP